MDNTALYVKQCEKAIKVQEAAPKHGSPEDLRSHHGYTNDGRWWLPDQSQLQAMMGEWWHNHGAFGAPLIKGLYDFAMTYKPRPFRESALPIKSWEQLWLAFVMNSKYGKRWDGRDWIQQ